MTQQPSPCRSSHCGPKDDGRPDGMAPGGRRRPPWLLAAAVAGVLAGCGVGPLQLRDGSIAACTGAARAGDGDLLGWVSVAAADRWIAAADRMGARAQLLAPGSSVREKLRNALRESAHKAGARDADWFDLARPMHLLVQHVAGGPAGADAGAQAARGLSALLPISGRDAFEAALAALSVKPGAGADFALRPKDAKAGTPPSQIAYLHPTIAHAALEAPQLRRAAAVGRCAQELRPRVLLQGGVALDALARHHGAKLDALLAEASSRGTGMAPGVPAAALAPWRRWITRTLAGARAVEVGVGDDDDDIVIDLDVHLKAGSELSASMARLAAKGPSPLPRRLPASTWLFSASASDATSAEEELGSALDMLRGLQLSEPLVASIEGMTRAAIRKLGAFSAVAFHLDGAFPLAMTGVMQSNDPAGLAAVLADGTMQVIRAAVLAQPDIASKLPPPMRAALDQGSWPAVIAFANAQLEPTVGTLQLQTRHADGVLCSVLRLDLKPTAGGGNPMVPMAMRVIGDHLEAGLCTGADALQVVFGHDALALAQAAEAGGKGAADGKRLTDQPWFKRAFGDGAGVALGALQPAPLLQVARGFLPTLPEWPAEASLHLRCEASAQASRCRMGVPAVAIAQVVRMLRGGFGG